MSGFNRIEKAIARLLSRFPFIKKSAKHIYSRLVYVKCKKDFTYQSITPWTSHSSASYSSFFGYYDKSPVNSAGLILANLTEHSTTLPPSPRDTVFIAVLDGNHLLFKVRISAYNWQQGCRAHWLNDDAFIVNDFDKQHGRYISRIYSVKKKEQIKEFSLPVQDSFKNVFFISLNYQRLMALRPDYGYRNLPALDNIQLANLKDDGLWYVDMSTGRTSLLISIEQVCAIKPTDNFNSARHCFNHVLISPNGKQLIFMHRFFLGQRRFDRLFLFDIASKKLTLLADNSMVSHCFWADDDTILGYMRGPGSMDAYWLIHLETLTFSRLPGNALCDFGDGHPHVHGDWFITDTYPDKARMQHLILCNWKTGSTKLLGEFFHGFEFGGESRCDLHPRFSLDGKKVFFDSVFTSKRQLYSIDSGI